MMIHTRRDALLPAFMLACMFAGACSETAPAPSPITGAAPAAASPVTGPAVTPLPPAQPTAGAQAMSAAPVLTPPAESVPATMATPPVAGSAALPPLSMMTPMPAPPPTAAAPSATGVSYHKDIRPLIETSCLDCHVPGGIGPVLLDSWDAVKPVGASVVGAVLSGVMPPSRWNNNCQPLHEDRSLSPEKRELFAMWRAAGFPEGNVADYVAPPPRTKKELGAPTIVMSSHAPYTPPAMADEYRCFVLDTIPDEAFLTGLQIIPGQTNEVHHVIIYRVAAAQLTQAKLLDDADSTPGYLCAGGPSVSSQNMFSYRPGSEAVTFEKGDAAYMEAGSSLIIQVHYNTVFLAAGTAPGPDETKVALWTLPKGQLPDRVVYRTTTFGAVNVPAGDPNWVSNISRPMNQLSVISSGVPNVALPIALPTGAFLPGEIIGMTPHAHQLAVQLHANLQREDGSSVCLDDVDWDFQWQLDYLFAKGVPYGPNDTFVADCVYDNSAANQPVIDGQQQPPRNVVFGERSIDEMCEHYIWLRFERDAFLKARSGL